MCIKTTVCYVPRMTRITGQCCGLIEDSWILTSTTLQSVALYLIG